MKLNRLPQNLITSTLTATVLITGALFTASAEDYNRDRQNNSQHNSRQYQKQPQQQSRQYQKPPQQQRNEYRHNDHASTYQHKNRHVTSSHNHGYSYRKEVFRTLPHGYRSFCHGNQNYYHHNGVFYNRYDHGYVVVQSPRFYHLPRHARQVVVNRSVYFVCDDTYYRSCGDYYEVCEAPAVERIVVCEPRPACHVENSVEINAGPVTIVLTDRH